MTLLEKLDALTRRAPNAARDPATFVRHYEDAARIIRSVHSLPPLGEYEGPRALAEDMVRQKQIKPVPGPDDVAFTIQQDARGQAIRGAFDAIAPMYWGPRSTLDECVGEIRNWLEQFAKGDQQKG